MAKRIAHIEDRPMQGFYEVEADRRNHRLFCCSNPNYQPHFHGSYELLFVREGSVRLLIDGEEHSMSVGDACFINSYQVHSYNCSDTAIAYIIVGVKSFFDDYFATLDGLVPETIFKYDNLKLLGALFEIYNDIDNPAIKDKMFSALIHVLLSDIYGHCSFIKNTVNKKNLIVCKLLEHVEENLTADLSLKTVSKLFHYSEAYISRLVNKYLGESWISYVNSQRILKAKSIIENDPEKSVEEIAFECGFNSVQTFYRIWHGKFGTQPKHNVKK